MMNKNEQSDDIFLTSDLLLTTTLFTLGFDIQSLNSQNPSRVVFGFIQSNELLSWIDLFWAGKLLVEPKKFWNAQRELKARIRTGEN